MNILQVEPGPARWRKFREGKTYKEKVKPIGTTADPPAGMAVDCISSWNLFCFDISFSCHPCLMLPLSLDPACSWHFWILTALLVDSFEARDLTHSSPDNVLLMSSLSLETDVFSAAFRWRLFLLASLSFGISFLETFFSWHTVFAWHHFSCFLLLSRFSFGPSFC